MTRGFSMVEVLVVIFIISVLMAFLLPALGKARSAARSVTCVSHLHELAQCFRLYANDNSGILPDAYSNHMTWEGSLQPYSGGRNLLVCPSDTELYPGGGVSSYDWRDTGDPVTTLAGHVISSARSNAVLVFDALPAWHSAKKVNAARVDGSARPMTEMEFFLDLSANPDGGQPCDGK